MYGFSQFLLNTIHSTRLSETSEKWNKLWHLQMWCMLMKIKSFIKCIRYGIFFSIHIFRGIVSSCSGVGFVIGSERNKIFSVIPVQNFFCFGFSRTLSQINSTAGLNGILYICSAQNCHKNQTGKNKNKSIKTYQSKKKLTSVLNVILK